MAKRFSGLKSFGSKAVSVIASGALALSLTPAIALANTGAADLQAQGANLSTQHYDPKYVDLAVIGNNGDPLNGDVKVTKNWNGHTVQYMGYAHGDGSHYKGYSIYTKITVDDNGILTGLDITSGNDTFAGKWGYNNVTVEGLLPKCVSFSATQAADDADGNAVWMPTLSGADAYGYALSSVTLISTNAAGTADARDVDQNFDGSRKVRSGRNEVAAPKYTSTVVAAKDGKIVIPKTAAVVTEANTTETAEIADADYYNLVQCTYTLGTEADKTQFNTYFMTGGAYEKAADAYLDNIVATSYDENPTSGYSTNRDGWTTVMGTMVLRQLGSWGATLADSSKNTGGIDGEIAAVDTVSGATKTSLPFIAALNKAKSAGYIKGVSENVKLTIDGDNAADAKSLPGLTVNNDVAGNSFQDEVTVAENAAGEYTLEGSFNKTGAGGRLSLDAIWLLDLSDVELGTQGIMALAKEIVNTDNDFSEYLVASYKPDKFGTGEPHLISYGDKTSGDGYTPVTEFKVSNTETQPISASEIEFAYKKASDSNMSYQMTVKKPEVTHVVMTYTLGHAKASSAYDLEAQALVPEVSALLAAANSSNPDSVTKARDAYDDLTYDVRPYTTGIGNLEAAEAAIVSQTLDKLSNSSSSSAVAAARSAYNALDAAAKAKVSSSAYKKLTSAEAAVAAKTVKKGDAKAVSGQTYKVTKVATAKAAGAVTLTKAKNAKSVTVPASVKLADGKTYKVTAIAASSFAKSKATKVTVKTTTFKKANVKNCFKGSKVTAVKVPAKKLTAYKKIFTKKITGSSKALKVTKVTK